jgi:hypothetical protein
MNDLKGEDNAAQDVDLYNVRSVIEVGNGPLVGPTSCPACPLSDREVSRPLWYSPASSWLFSVRPAGRTYLGVKVLYTLDKGKC